MLETLTSIFSNRELATGLWLFMFMGFVISQPGIRGALASVLRAILQFKLLVLFSTLAVWLSVGVLVLWQIGWWALDHLKLTILWYLFSGTVLLANSIQNQRDARFFRDAVTGQFKAVAALEFIVVFYSFAFWKEMVFLPFMTIIAVMQAMSETKAEYAPAKKLLDGILLIVGVALIVHFVLTASSDHGTLFNLATLREVTIPILYSLWALPVCYLWWCYARWEEARIQLNQKTYHSDDLRSYAGWQFLRSFFLRPVLLKRAVRQFNLLPAMARQDVQEIISKIRAYEAGRCKSRSVATQIGWCPYLAKRFLAAEGYETNDFHDSGFNGEWFAESQTTYLKEAGPFETLIYRIKGREELVKIVQINGSFNVDPTPDTGLAEMACLCASLIQAATANENMPSQIVVGFEDRADVKAEINHHCFKLKFMRYEDTNILDVEFTCAPKSILPSD